MKEAIIKLILDKCSLDFATAMNVEPELVDIRTPTKTMIMLHLKTPQGPRFFEIKVVEKQ
jgi:hypothetical protein